MKILVTGGAGFIGSHIVDQLLKSGDTVIVLFDKTRAGKIAHVENEVEWVHGNIKNFKLCQKAVKDVDAVIHLAALINIDHSIQTPLPFYEVNVKGTQNLLEAVKREPSVKKFTYMSTCEVYGNVPKGKANEKAPCYPRSPYASSKYAAERYCLSYHYTYNKPEITIIRGFNIFGPRQGYVAVRGAVIPIFINKILNNQPIKIFGSGKQTRDYTYVMDVANGIIKATMKMGIGGEIFNIASGKTISIKKIAYNILKLTNSKSEPVYINARAGEMMRSCGDASKANKILNWKINVPFKKGLKETVKYFKKKSN